MYSNFLQLNEILNKMLLSLHNYCASDMLNFEL